MCVCVCLHERIRLKKKKTKTMGIASECRAMFNEVKKQFRSTEGLRKHIFYVSLRFQDSEMCKHNNGLFGNVLQPRSDLQLEPISSHMGIVVAHCFNVLFISCRSIFSYCLLLSMTVFPQILLSLSSGNSVGKIYRGMEIF